MNIFEYQGKEFYKEYGIKTPEGILVSSPDEIRESSNSVVVKAQVLTGGRGKSGAVVKCGTLEEARNAAENIFSMKIKGHVPKKVLVEDCADIDREFYFSIYPDRKKKLFSMMFTDQGGVEIESLSAEAITVVDINPLIGLKDYMVRNLLLPYGLEKDKELADTIKKAYKLFMDKKLLLLEINPLVKTKSGEIMALDSKINMDDWAVDPSIDVEELDAGDTTEFERKMSKYKATAVELSGDIVSFGGGAGAALAGADSLVAHGGTVRAIVDRGQMETADPDPAVREKAQEGFRMVLDLKPKAIFLNLYYQAGDLEAECKSVKAVYEEPSKELPIILRLKGRNADKGRKLLEGTNIFITDSYSLARDRVLEIVKEGR